MNRSKSRLRKTQCDKCGAILYGSTAALKASAGVVCGCGGRFQVVHAEDRELVNERKAEQ